MILSSLMVFPMDFLRKEPRIACLHKTEIVNNFQHSLGVCKHDSPVFRSVL